LRLRGIDVEADVCFWPKAALTQRTAEQLMDLRDIERIEQSSG
jgi:hypothetical protein